MPYSEIRLSSTASKYLINTFGQDFTERAPVRPPNTPITRPFLEEYVKSGARNERNVVSPLCDPFAEIREALQDLRKQNIATQELNDFLSTECAVAVNFADIPAPDFLDTVIAGLSADAPTALLAVRTA